MKVVSMIDSFKGSVSSERLNEAALSGLQSHCWREKVNVPIADGGEGTMAAIFSERGGKWLHCEVADLLGRPREVTYLLTEIDTQSIAVIESTQVVGMELAPPSDEVTKQATSYGLGTVLFDAQQKGATMIYLTLGGSVTSDGGLGMLQALAGEPPSFSKGNPLLYLTEFPQVNSFKTPIIALADVVNPYSGRNGFAAIFAKQKGATTATITLLNQKAQQLSQQLKEVRAIDLEAIPGTGAAGGLGAAVRLVDGEIKSGFAILQSLLHLEEKIQGAQLIFTGEGKFDSQTLAGKVPAGVVALAKQYEIPVIALCGQVAADEKKFSSHFLGVFSVQTRPLSLEEAMNETTTCENMKTVVSQLERVFLYSCSEDM